MRIELESIENGVLVTLRIVAWGVEIKVTFPSWEKAAAFAGAIAYRRDQNDIAADEIARLIEQVDAGQIRMEGLR